MELIFLGTGTSQGVPMIAQTEDAPIDMQDPRNWRTRSSVHVVMDGLHIQVDASQEMRLQCIREKIPSIDLFILTHGHADHILGMDDLRRYCDLKGGSAIPAYSTREGLERMRAIFPYACHEKPVAHGYPAFAQREMPARLELPQGTIESTLLPHGRVQTLGLLFTEKSSGRRLAYYTDCAEVPEAGVALAKGADLVVLDALRPRAHPTHMNTERALAAAASIGGNRTLFTHLTFEIDHATASAALPPGIEYAWDGLRVTLA
jgi:phosphoribosyl 1,2-cyclic phosphate phosphodiesterase